MLIKGMWDIVIAQSQSYDYCYSVSQLIYLNVNIYNVYKALLYVFYADLMFCLLHLFFFLSYPVELPFISLFIPKFTLYCTILDDGIF